MWPQTSPPPPPPPAPPLPSIDDVVLSDVALECDAVWRWVNPHSINAEAATAIHNVQRYRDNGELRYSMRSWAAVEGLRRLHTVAKGAPPSWLDASHPRIFWWNETMLLEQACRLHSCPSKSLWYRLTPPSLPSSSTAEGGPPRRLAARRGVQQ